MRFFNIFLCIVGLTCPFTEGEVDHYNLEINEKGTALTEGVEIDEEQKVEIFRVPGHNSVSAADFYHDFEREVTVIKILSEQVCYITKMDPSLPSPRKLKEDIKRATSLRGSRTVTTKTNLLMPTSPAHRPSLTKGMLAFCGVLPIYKGDVFPMNTSNNGEGTVMRELRLHTRQTRQAGGVKKFILCSSAGYYAAQKCLVGSYKLRCRFQSDSFYYYVTCRKKAITFSWDCSNNTHLTYSTPMCCDVVCPEP